MKIIIKRILMFIGYTIGFCTLIIVGFICYRVLEDAPFQKAVAKCKTIRVGMTREEVMAMFGKDTHGHDSRDHKTHSLSLAPSGAIMREWEPAVTIRNETGKVVEVLCAPADYEARFNKIVAECSAIRLGMTREEVLATLGEGVRDHDYDVSGDTGTSRLIIIAPEWYKWTPSIIIRKGTKQVEKINCTPH